MARTTSLDLSALLLRLVLAVVFIGHGGQKLFGWFGGDGLSAEVDAMRDMTIEPAGLWALLLGLGELGGGLLALLGLLTPFAAAAIAAVMAGAIVTSTGAGGFFIQNNGYEYNVVLMCICAALIFSGAGSLSVDRLIANSRWAPDGVSNLLRQRPSEAR